MIPFERVRYRTGVAADSLEVCFQANYAAVRKGRSWPQHDSSASWARGGCEDTAPLHFTSTSFGSFHVPSINGCFGPYMRLTMKNGPFGVGSQLDSFSGPGLSLCR